MKPGEYPPLYWRPWLGAEFSLRPSDIGEITPAQLDACREFAGR
jgi:hypothetical protein